MNISRGRERPDFFCMHKDVTYSSLIVEERCPLGEPMNQPLHQRLAKYNLPPTYLGKKESPCLTEPSGMRRLGPCFSPWREPRSSSQGWVDQRKAVFGTLSNSVGM